MHLSDRLNMSCFEYIPITGNLTVEPEMKIIDHSYDKKNILITKNQALAFVFTSNFMSNKECTSLSFMNNGIRSFMMYNIKKRREIATIEKTYSFDQYDKEDVEYKKFVKSIIISNLRELKLLPQNGYKVL